jgi:hypothetical protein
MYARPIVTSVFALQTSIASSRASHRYASNCSTGHTTGNAHCLVGRRNVPRPRWPHHLITAITGTLSRRADASGHSGSSTIRTTTSPSNSPFTSGGIDGGNGVAALAAPAFVDARITRAIKQSNYVIIT